LIYGGQVKLPKKRATGFFPWNSERVTDLVPETSVSVKSGAWSPALGAFLFNPHLFFHHLAAIFEDKSKVVI